jgi:hypothetical protein
VSAPGRRFGSGGIPPEQAAFLRQKIRERVPDKVEADMFMQMLGVHPAQKPPRLNHRAYYTEGRMKRSEVG